ncbi:MAG: DUF4388 domain-containing protein [Myxococcaceae bacterium]
MTPRFRLERGRLSPQDDEARAELANRSGEYLLMPTVPDLLCLFRTEPTGAPGPSPRVVLAGDASGFALADLIAYLGQSRWTGAIRVHAPSGQRTISLKDGELKGANSDNPADRLGEVMVRMGFVTREQLEQTLQDNPPSRLGRALVEKGIVQAHDVWNCVTEQVSEIFQEIVLCRDGVFFLLDQVPEEKSAQNVQLSLQSLLMDSFRKVDELAHFRKRIPHGRIHVVPRRGADGKLEPDEDRVLALVDGKRTVLELGAAARLVEFDVTRIVYRLLEGGYVKLSEQPVAPDSAQEAAPPAAATPVAPRTTPARDPAVVIRIYNQVFGEIRTEVAKQEMARELIAAANAALSGRALSQSPVLEGIRFDPGGALPEKELLEKYQRLEGTLGSEPVAALRAALSDVMFFLLFQAGELLESRQDELLARRVKELLAPLDAAS